jgi:hypothetical protein
MNLALVISAGEPALLVGFDLFRFRADDLHRRGGFHHEHLALQLDGPRTRHGLAAAGLLR